MEILLYACCVKALPLLLFFYGFSFHEHLLKFTSCASKETMSFDEVYNNNDNKRSSQCYAVYGLSKLIMMMRWFCWHIINLLRFVFSRVSSVWRKFNVLLCCVSMSTYYVHDILFVHFIENITKLWRRLDANLNSLIIVICRMYVYIRSKCCALVRVRAGVNAYTCSVCI